MIADTHVTLIYLLLIMLNSESGSETRVSGIYFETCIKT